ncbi:MAG: hypothetical protein FWG63_05105 [Defluviitaleaceae bacterium]|nr:hypothetical protein [Defluviitaleaceae bacterium]
MREKISFKDFEIVMQDDVLNYDHNVLDIGFYIDGCNIYRVTWMGKAKDEETDGDSYWFGLDNSEEEGHDYPTFEEFTNAKVFYGTHSLKDLWDKVSITSLNGGTCEEMLPYYINN